jgi:putative FmdB family regulatory protein
MDRWSYASSFPSERDPSGEYRIAAARIKRGACRLARAAIDAAARRCSILATVPLYDYKCRKCGKRFEELVKVGQNPECPRCHDPRPERLFSMSAAVSTSTTRERAARVARRVARGVKREKDHADAEYHRNYIKEHSEPAAPAPKKKRRG